MIPFLFTVCLLSSVLGILTCLIGVATLGREKLQVVLDALFYLFISIAIGSLVLVVTVILYESFT